MKDKDNILDFDKIKKKMEDEKNSSEENSFFSIFKEMGIDLNNSEINDLISNLDIEKIMEDIQNGTVTQEQIDSYMEKFKIFEKNLNNAKKTYRAFSQWQSFYKPYNLTTLFPLEQIRGIARFLNIEYLESDSKNNIISKITPEITNYLEKLFMKLDIDFMKYIGIAIYNDGIINVEKPLKESEELLIDFLQQKCILSRVNEMGKHIIVIPKEINEAINKIDFIKISKFNELNTFINKTAVAFANSYGVCPKSLFLDRVEKEIEEKYNFIEEKNDYIKQNIDYFFSRKKPISAFYSGISIDENYLKHGIIDLTKYLFDLQNENIEKYKYLSNEEIYKRGNILYFEESIHLNEVVDIVLKNQKLDEDEIISLKNIIFIFSYIEFEPNLIIQLLSSKYIIEENGKIIDILRKYYQNREKWILKGHTPFEVNNAKNFDISNIIRINFGNEREEDE